MKTAAPRKKKTTPKPPSPAELAEVAELEAQALERTTVTEAIPEWVSTLAQPLNALLVAGPRAVAANTSYNRKVLALIIRGLTRVNLVANVINLIYTAMADTIASQVGTLASKEVSEEQAEKRRTAAAKKMADAGAPFWRIARIIQVDGAAGVTSLLEQAQGKNASLGRLNKWTQDRINALVFDPSRGSMPCNYTLRDGVEVLFTIEDATIAWDHYQHEVAHTKLLYDEHSQEWSAARRQYRAEYPAGMPDGRSKKERKVAARAANRALVSRVRANPALTDKWTKSDLALLAAASSTED